MSTTPTAEESGSTYVLGHADAEVQRLLLRGRLYNDYTEHVLRLAGLRPGMRVLDIGCGPSDVSFVAAPLVGPSGTVLGVDAAPADAGLGAPRLTLGTPIGTAADTNVLAYAAEAWRLVSAIAQQHGFAIDEVADIDGSVPRFRRDVLAAIPLIITPPMITAWAQVHQPSEPKELT